MTLKPHIILHFKLITMANDLMEKIVSLCKRRGFVFPGSEIYGGLANSWDFGPLGVEMKNNIKQRWWKKFVQERPDMLGLDAALIMNPKVWEASGHLNEFTDPLVECKRCHARFRTDQLETDSKGKYICLECEGKEFTLPRNFNLMFKTFMGPAEEAANAVYLRPETAQGIFADFKNILDSSRKKIPFGIGQIGKAFRNEITPGNFIFRMREFEQMEIEYFIPEPKNDNEWLEYFQMWRHEIIGWIKDCGIDFDKEIFELDVPDGERAHYSKKTIDFQYKFPFGEKELYGLAYRGNYDLSRHQKHSGQDLFAVDEDGNKFIPHVSEPSLGVERTVLAALCSAYREEMAPDVEGGEDKRIVLKFPAWLAPIKVAILPLSKKEELSNLSRRVYDDLKKHFVCEYDETQSIGKRYRRQDEIGTPFCVTVDFESLNDMAATVRERDSMRQERIKMEDIRDYLEEKLEN